MATCPHCGAELGLTLVATPLIPKPFRRSARCRFGLTQREGEVVDLAVEGMTNAAIAAQLGTKLQVVKNYLRMAYIKIGCSSRTEMINMVLFGSEARR